jgi:hypothetical protein
VQPLSKEKKEKLISAYLSELLELLPDSTEASAASDETDALSSDSEKGVATCENPNTGGDGE